MRKVQLKNAHGQTFDLLRRDAIFKNMDGIGFRKETDFSRVGDDFIKVESLLSQKIITGTMLFDSEDAYNEFLKFIRYAPLQFGYSQRSEWRYIKCIVSNLKKREITPYNEFCEVDVDFTSISQWQKNTQIVTAQRSERSGKTYDYAYPYSYVDGAMGSAKIVNTGFENAPMRVHIFGPCQHPFWTMMQSGRVIGSGKVNTVINSGEQLIVDSSPLTLEMSRRDQNEKLICDEYQNGDFSTDRFLLAPIGESELIFSHEGSETLKVIIEVNEIAETV